MLLTKENQIQMMENYLETHTIAEARGYLDGMQAVLNMKKIIKTKSAFKAGFNGEKWKTIHSMDAYKAGVEYKSLIDDSCPQVYYPYYQEWRHHG